MFGWANPPSTQPSSSAQPSTSRQQGVEVREEPLANPLSPARHRRRNIDRWASAQSGSSARYPSLPIYPALPTRVPDRPTPSQENPNLPWFGSLICGESQVLIHLLLRGRIEEGGPVMMFELTHEGDNFDNYWGMDAYLLHPARNGVGHNRWIYGQPRVLPMDRRGAHVGDMVKRTLRFMDIPLPSPPAV